MSLERELRKKYKLLEESWVKKEVNEDAPVAPVAVGGTATPEVAQFKNKLGAPVAPNAPGALKEAPSGELFGDKKADNMYRGLSQMIDTAFEALTDNDAAMDVFKSVIEKCQHKIMEIQKGFNANESASPSSMNRIEQASPEDSENKS